MKKPDCPETTVQEDKRKHQSNSRVEPRGDTQTVFSRLGIVGALTAKLFTKWAWRDGSRVKSTG